MAQTMRPLSPHLGIYRWQVQMVTSILHRATGMALCVGLLVVTWGLLALAGGQDAWDLFTACASSVIGIIVLVGWSWAFFFHLCNGIRHLLQDAGMGFRVEQFVRSSWLSVGASVVLTVLAWIWVWQEVAA